MPPSHDEKEFLALLQSYTSEETRRARRNLSTVSFMVIAAWIVGVRLNDIRILGADLTKAHEATVLLLGLVVVAYWLVVFLVAWFHDREIERERKIQGDQAARAVVKELERLEKRKSKNEQQNFVPSGYAEAKRAVDAYNRQISRTAKAKRYGGLLRAMELYVPLILTVGALVVLAIGTVCALTPRCGGP